MKCSMHIHSDEGSDRFLHPFFPKKLVEKSFPSILKTSLKKLFLSKTRNYFNLPGLSPSQGACFIPQF